MNRLDGRIRYLSENKRDLVYGTFHERSTNLKTDGTLDGCLVVLVVVRGCSDVVGRLV